MTSLLDARQLRTLGVGDDVSVDPVTGGFVGDKVVYVKPEFTLKATAPQLIARGNDEPVTIANTGFISGSAPGYKIVHASEGTAQAEPGQRIAIVFGTPIKDPITLQMGFASALILDADELSAHWSGVNSTNTGVRLLVRDTYSNGGQLSYNIGSMQWTQGSADSERLVAGVASKPDEISQTVWDYELGNLGPRVYMAGGGDDQIVGDAMAEVLNGEAGNDTLTGAGGADTLTGGTGIDQFVFNSGSGQDVITDLESIDSLRFTGMAAGTVSRTTSYSSSTKDSFSAATVLTYGAADQVGFTSAYSPTQLGSSDQTLYSAQFDSSSQTIKIDGKTITSGADVIVQAKYGSTTINTLGGDDILFALTQNHLNLDAGDGQDTVYALEGGDSIQGGTGNDRIEITSATGPVAADTLIGGAGNDTLYAGDHGAVLYGDDQANTLSGADSLRGGTGNDILYGGAGDDILRGLDGADMLYGQAGADIMDGGTGTDSLYGGTEDDVLAGQQGNDYLDGGDGNDILSGGTENDSLYGGVGNDLLIGGDGSDLLVGGVGDDVLTTGSGNDTIQLDMTSGNDTADSLTGVDTVRISGVASAASVGFQLLDNGARVKLSWGTGNSLVLTGYDSGIKFQFDSITNTLGQIFSSKGYHIDSSFDYLSAYDTQLQGNNNEIGTLIGSGNNDQLYGGPLTGNENEDPAVNGVRSGGDNAAYWYVVGRAGDDSLAGGLSGAILDGGIGNDTFQGRNGVAILRDTFHGGQDTLVMPNGVTPESLKFYRIPHPLDTAILKEYGYYGTYYASGSAIGLENKLPNPVLPTTALEWGRHISSYWPEQHFDTLRIQSADGKLTVDVIGYFETGTWKNDIANILFPTVFDVQGNSVSYALGDMTGSTVKGGEYTFNGGYGSNVYSQVAGQTVTYDSGRKEKLSLAERMGQVWVAKSRCLHTIKTLPTIRSRQ